MTTKNYKQLTDDYRRWLNELKFYQDEIMYFEQRVKEVFDKNTKEDVRMKCGHFKNLFLTTADKMNALKQEVTKYEKHLAERMELASRMKVAVAEDFHTLENDMNKFSTEYETMKSDFTKFLEKSL